MSEELILHHYDISPFCEKVRLAMGLKKLSWRSVYISIVPPRPFLESLTGGYRRCPVLQVGADIHCDTHLILRTLNHLRPDSPALFSNSTTQPLCWWWDKSTFVPSVATWTGLNANLPQAVVEDRKNFAPFFTMTEEANETDVPVNAERMNSHIVWLTVILSDGRQFLQEEQSALDVTAYHTLWFLKKIVVVNSKVLFLTYIYKREVNADYHLNIQLNGQKINVWSLNKRNHNALN